MSQVPEEFELWLKSGFRGPFRLGPHRFERREGKVLVDGGSFTIEEAKVLVEMLTSSNPLLRLSASLTILERNGILRFLLIIGAVLLLILVYIWVKH
ncbi:hypothetical protein KEJ36_00465 [Candidatus Bathyarchaeota archaeon]|nr:hypothetical protein [Candidatus Bathyarchaeota archaeon]MBS7627296.1 hypothetical protein [Candidatus Bathyarchaeota archaeon]